MYDAERALPPVWVHQVLPQYGEFHHLQQERRLDVTAVLSVTSVCLWHSLKNFCPAVTREGKIKMKLEDGFHYCVKYMKIR